MNKRTLGLSAIAMVTLIIAWSIILYYFTPTEIINYIGLENGYIITFLGGILGGTSLFFPFPNYLLVLTFGAAGLNPILLGISAGIGVIIGESTSYLFGHFSHSLLPTKWSELSIRFRKWLLTRPQSLIMAILFVIGVLFPFPNDLILVPLGIARYSFWRTIIPLGLGNILFNVGIALTGQYGLSLFFA